MKAKLTEEEFVNWWLTEYHDTNLNEVRVSHPQWKDSSYSREFYEAYPVTQEQHDEWYEWAIERLMKHYKISKKRAKKDFSFPYLNVSPLIKKP